MTPDVETVIRLEGVSKSYPTGFWRSRVRVLFDLSLEVRRNEIVGFLGPNGAGKTTTLKLLNRLAFPDSGTIRVLGEDAGGTPALRRRIGFMPEQPYFYEYLDGNEFLRLCGHLNGMHREEIGPRTREILARVGLEGAGDKAIRKYSKGMMQRLGLAQALIHDPELVILDEPMSGLDPMGRMEVRNLIRELQEAGKTVFFSSHIITDVEMLCDRAVMLLQGRKVAEGAVHDMMGEELLYVEMTFHPVPEPARRAEMAADAADGRVQGDAWVVRAPGYEEAERVVSAAREAGSRLRSMVPVKRRLEEIYMAQVEAAGGRRGNG